MAVPPLLGIIILCLPCGHAEVSCWLGSGAKEGFCVEGASTRAVVVWSREYTFS